MLLLPWTSLSPGHPTQKMGKMKMLRSRNCYKALRDILPLPHKNTLRSYFGKLGSPDSESACKEVISKVFAEFEDPTSKYCFITADEITIKPLQFQKNQIIGYAMDAEDGQVAKKVVAIMVNPSMGMPAFVA